MRRRVFITFLGGAAAWPLAARAQQPAMPVIGLLCSGSPNAFASFVAAFQQGLNETGFVEHRNVGIEYRWAEDQNDRLPALAADLVRRQVSLIAALGNQRPALAAKAATTTIPIVFVMGADPVQNGLVASLNRPGANITGMTQLQGVLVSKRMQMLHDLVPNAKVFGVLSNPNNNTGTILKDSQDAARALGGTIEIASARSEADFEAAFAGLAQRRVDALNVLPDTLFSAHPERLAALAARFAIPTIFTTSSFPKAGGLMSYGADSSDNFQQAGVYAGRILKGERPADMPVQQSAKFELVINLKTATALGLTVSNQMQLLADEVIE
jgi:putative ABC transport system substrate-binding protein